MGLDIDTFISIDVVGFKFKFLSTKVVSLAGIEPG
jgi:hypothetical protein